MNRVELIKYHVDMMLLLMANRVIYQDSIPVIVAYLKRNHSELLQLRIGNYDSNSDDYIKMINDFMGKFGYQLIGKKIDSGKRIGEMAYKLIGGCHE